MQFFHTSRLTGRISPGILRIVERSKPVLSTRLLGYALLGVLCLLLIGVAWKGAYSRYLQDDYCYGAEVVRLGFAAAQIDSYFTPMPYNSNRFSLNLFSGIAEILGGPGFSPVLTALMIVAWAAACFFAFRQAGRLSGRAGDPWVGFTGVLAILFFSILLAPSQYQVIFWRSAIFPYWVPVILTVLILGLCLRLSHSKSFRLLAALTIGLASFVAGGFSEAAAAWQIALLGMLFLSSFLGASSWKKMRYPLGWALGGALAAFLVLALCPANAHRIQSLGLQQPGFRTLASKALQFGLSYSYIAIRVRQLDFIAVTGLGFWLGLTVRPEMKLRPWHAIRAGLAASLACYLLVVASVLPSLYTLSSPPDGRALFPAQFSLILTVCFSGWLAVQFVFGLKPGWDRDRIVKGLSIMIGILMIAYFIARIPGVYGDLSAYRSRAHAWDLRQELIRASIRAGEQDLVVPQFDSLNQVAELRPEADFWVNTCAARYYQVHSITALEGYQGFPSNFK